MTYVETEPGPPPIRRALKNGPKFAVEPKLHRAESLAIGRDVASKAFPEDRDRCHLDGVDSLQRCSKPTSTKIKMRQVAKFFVDKGQKLVLADKEGGFVVL